MRQFRFVILAVVLSACATPAREPLPSPSLPPGITAPVLVHRVEPEYPPELRRDRVTGTVTIEALIDKTGQLLNPRVLRSADPRLNDLALAAVRKWRFRPGTVNGEPVDVIFQVSVRFSI